MTKQQFVDSINRLVHLAVTPIQSEAQGLVNAYIELASTKETTKPLDGNGELKKTLSKDSVDASKD